MPETLIVALAVILGVVVIMVTTILKNGHEAAIKMWGVMGALTGVAFGGITSYYFTNQARDKEVALAMADSERYRLALDEATDWASQAQALVATSYASLEADTDGRGGVAIGTDPWLRLSAQERSELVAGLRDTSEILTQIQALPSDSPATAGESDAER
ncbi:MAG: hypothetical protein HC882_02370 [Acidobacteria bacterium]|nr:hypothetical protein [Acidobacteriota bacterium]